jgi:hypothetical protein
MTKVLSIVAALAVGLVCAGVVSAKTAVASQPSKKEAKWVKPHELYGKLNGLRSEQKAQIKSILAQAKVDARKAQSNEEKANIWKAADEKIRTTVLTADQCKQLDELEHAKATRHHKGLSSQPAGVKHHLK